MSTRFALVASILFGFGTTAYAAPVTFNLLDPTGTAGTAGEAFENELSFSDSGLTIDFAVSTTLGSGSGSYSATTSQGGVNSVGVAGGGGDAASELDAGETLTFSFTFGPTLLVSLESVDLQGVGDNTDSATVNVNGSPITLFVGAPSVVFNGTLDLWTTGGINIPSGSTVIVTTNDRIGVQAFTFDVMTIPEPSSAGLVGLGVVGWIARRRRK